jgi:hypothetical protein
MNSPNRFKHERKHLQSITFCQSAAVIGLNRIKKLRRIHRRISPDIGLATEGKQKVDLSERENRSESGSNGKGIFVTKERFFPELCKPGYFRDGTWPPGFDA